MVAHAPAEGGALSLFERGTLGAVAGICTTFITHPLDVIRVQMQVAEGTEGAAARGSIGTTMNIVKNQGALGLYEGISAAWLRQVLYGSFRLGVLFGPYAGATAVCNLRSVPRCDGHDTLLGNRRSSKCIQGQLVGNGH